MPEITFTIAFIAGLLSFLSPCLLPLVPFYIAYLAGDTVAPSDRKDNSTNLKAFCTPCFSSPVFRYLCIFWRLRHCFRKQLIKNQILVKRLSRDSYISWALYDGSI